MLVNAVHWSVDRPLPEADEKVSTWKIERADKKKRTPKKAKAEPRKKKSSRADSIPNSPDNASLPDRSPSAASGQSPIEAGDHIAFVGNTFADQLRIHGYLETLLTQNTRENPVSVRNLGWGGDMLTARDRPAGFPTEESTLIEHKTDVIVACFGMGESFEGQAGLEGFKSELKTFIASHAGKQYNGSSEVRMILVSPIAYEDLGALTPQRDQRNRDLKSYTQAMKDVAHEANVPFVDLFEASSSLMARNSGPKLTGNGIHLNAYGYWAVSHMFYDQLTAGGTEPPKPSWLLKIDANAKSASARGVDIADLIADKSGFSFSGTQTSAPRLRPPTDQSIPRRLQSVRDTLIVENLDAGNYQLTVDGTVVAIASAEVWSNGVAIDSSPMHKSAESYRALINDKNLQFTYSWKALNQVHIVGQRRSSASGRELPREVFEFNELARKLDKALANGVEIKTRKWSLTRVSP